MKSVYLAHYHEIGLKGKNRKFFEDCLCRNIAAIVGLDRNKIRLSSGRLVINEKKVAPKDKLKFVFGLSSYAPALLVLSEKKSIEKAALELIKKQKFASFAVSASRGDKSFPLTSVEINQLIGHLVQKKTKVKVNLENPELRIWIEIARKEAFVYREKIKGPGGLPVGSQGRILVLLSGGIDSPAAAWLMAKRGSPIDFIHFHSYPFTSRASIDKVKKLVEILSRYTLASRLFLVSFGEIQKAILKNCSERFRVILYRRVMIRIAEKIAAEKEALALATGESLGQVASQTLKNLRVIEDAVDIPVLRPLIGFDKEEIISLARKIGTFETSILPHDDCCSLFLPKHPATKARLEDVLREEKKLKVKQLIDKAIKNVEIVFLAKN